MACISAYARKAMLDWLMGGATPTRPGPPVFVGLSLGTPTSVSGSEASFAGYARRTAFFAAAASPAGTASNSTQEAFPNSGPASLASIRGWQIWDTLLSSNSGNMLMYGTMSAATTIASGSSLIISTGSLLISLA